MTFLFPYLLWLLPLSLLPLIFHLFNRRKYSNIKFSSLKFFKIIEEETLKKISIYNILLLIIRTLIILLIILIVSRPYVKGAYNSSLDLNNQSLTVLLIDNSFSNTFYNENNVNKLLENIKKTYSPNTNIFIYTTNDQTPIYTDKIDKLIIKQLEITKNNKTSSLSSSINNINFDKYTEYLNKTLIIISDYQENFIDVKSINNMLDESWTTILYKTNNDYNNISITKVDIDKEMIIPNELINFNISLQNNGNYDLDNRVIELYINDIKVGFEQFDIKAKTNINLIIKSSLADIGNHNCFIKLENDDLSLDNYYYFNINIPKKRNIAILSENEDDHFFLKEAINSFNEKYNNFNLTIFNYNEFLKSDIASINSLFIFGYEHFDNSIISKTDNKNISITLFPKFDTIKHSHDDMLFNILNDVDLKDINLTSNMDGQFVNLNFSNIEKKFLKDIYDIKSINRNLKIFNYNNIKSNKNTILEYSNNSAFINYYKKNGNNIFLFTTSLSLKDTNFPIKGTFLPIIYNLININNSKIFYFPDEDIKELSNYLDGNKITITNPNNDIYYYNQNDLNNNIFNETGYYKLFNQETNQENYLSVNVNEDEFQPSLTKNQIMNKINNSIYFERGKNLKEYLNNLLYGYEIWRYLLYILVLLVCVEMFLSNYYLYGRK